MQDVRTLSVPSGYANDLISPHNIVFNGFGVAATLSSATRFSLTSGYFAAAWNNGLTVTIVGTLASAAVFAQSFVVNTTGPSFVMLNHATVDSVVFSSFGGTRVLLGRGTQFALDNLTLNEAAAIPEPAAWAMLVIGFGLIGAERRLVRRRSAPPRRQIIPGAPIACCRSAAVLSTQG